MQVEHLGRYRLVAPLPTRGDGYRWFSAVHEENTDGPEANYDGSEANYMVKLLDVGRGGQGEAQLARFEHEVKLLRVLNHPGILSLHAWGEQDGVPYMVLDQVDGVDLATLCGHHTDEPRALGKEIAVYVVAQLVDAIRQLHELALDEEGDEVSLQAVHRGLCPANILCSTSGDVLLSEFGAAHSRWLPPTHLDPQAGPLAYRAPERLMGDGIAEVRSDLFSIAVILWEILRGQRCFPGDDATAVRDAILRFDVSHPSRRVPGLSPKLSEVMRKNLDRDPGRRYADAYQMLQRLAQAPEAQAAAPSRDALAELVRGVLARPA